MVSWSVPSCVRAEEVSYPGPALVRFRGREPDYENRTGARHTERHWGLRPFEGRVKVFVVNNCQNLSEEAGNSLLKIVEEPPLDTVIILIAESSRLVLPTIVSPLKIKFTNTSRGELVRILRDKGADEKLSGYLAYSSSGG